MTGLLKKDLSLTMVNKKLFMIIPFVALMLLVMGNGDNVSFVMGYLAVMFGILVLTTISYDEMDHSDTFLLTLPVSRELYVREKYVFALLTSFGGWLLSLFFTGAYQMIAGSGIADWASWLGGSAAFLPPVFLLLAIIIPVQLKFGADNGRIVMVLMVGIMGISKFLEGNGIDIGSILNRFLVDNTVFTIITAVLAAALALMASLAVSIGIMRKKQF